MTPATACWAFLFPTPRRRRGIPLRFLRLRGESQFSFHRRDAEIAENLKLPERLFAAQPRGWLASVLQESGGAGGPALPFRAGQ